jgi:hypothetical protein
MPFFQTNDGHIRSKMPTKLRYQMTREELIDEALTLHFQRFPVKPKEIVAPSNPRIEYLEKRFGKEQPEETQKE